MSTRIFIFGKMKHLERKRGSQKYKPFGRHQENSRGEWKKSNTSIWGCYCLTETVMCVHVWVRSLVGIGWSIFSSNLCVLWSAVCCWVFDWWMNRRQVSRREARSAWAESHRADYYHHTDRLKYRPVTLESAGSERFFFIFNPDTENLFIPLVYYTGCVIHRCVMFSALNLLCKAQL